MWSVFVVMVHEDVENAFKMPVVQDQQPIQANGAHEPLRHTVRLRRAKRRANDLEPMAAKQLFKTVGEFLVSVANQEAERLWALCQRPRQVPGLLGHPRRTRIRRAAREVHTAARNLIEAFRVMSGSNKRVMTFLGKQFAALEGRPTKNPKRDT